MMKRFLVTAALTASLTLALMFVPLSNTVNAGPYAGVAKSIQMALCGDKYSKVIPWTNKNQKYLHRAFEGDDINLLHQAIYNRPLKNTDKADKVEVYFNPSEPVGALIIYKAGCVLHVASVPVEIILKSMVRFDELKRGI